jgi:DNA-binding transcriptional MerR regulator
LPKAMEAFRNIGEVSAELGVRKHVLRFWESKFPQLKPMKRGGLRRYYRPADVQLLRGIQHLLQSHHIKGVQKILREGGVEDVKKIGKAQEANLEASREASRESGREQRGPARLSAASAGTDSARQLSAAQMGALRAVMVELDAVRAILGGARETNAGAQRPKRAAPRG